MARNTRSDVGPQVPQLWSSQLYAGAEDMTFWGRFEGPEGSGMPIIRKDDLTKTAGDTIKTDIVLPLSGTGVVGDTVSLTGNEEKLDFRQMNLSIADLSHAVRWTELTEQVISHNMRGTALNQLQKWLAGRIDNSIWAELTSAAVPAVNKRFAGSATSIATIADTDTGGRLKLNDISRAKAYAQSVLKIEPLRTEDGNEWFGMVIDPFTNMSLKLDSAYQQAQIGIGLPDKDNRLFNGAAFVWDGVIGYVSNRVPAAADGASGVRVARNVFFGGQAMQRGYGMLPDWREEFFDYGREAGVATTLIKGEKRIEFDFSAAKDGSNVRALGHFIMHSAAVSV